MYCEVRDVEQCEGQQAAFRGPHPQGAGGHPFFLLVLTSFVPPVSCSLLCQHHATMHFCQLFHPDPLCQVSNNVTTEVNCLLFPEALDDATRCVSPLASTDSVTDSPFPLSPPSLHDLQEIQYQPLYFSLFPSPPPILSPKPMTPYVTCLHLNTR